MPQKPRGPYMTVQSERRVAERLENSYDPKKRQLGAQVRASVLRCCTAPAAHWTECRSAICTARRHLFKTEGEICDGCREWTPHGSLLLCTVKLPHLHLDGPVALCPACRQLVLPTAAPTS